MQKEQRNLFIQAVRGICILAVILIHCKNGSTFEQGSAEYTYSIILRQIINFPVAVFVFLSGYCTNTEKINTSYIGKRIKRLIIPYIVWSLFYFVVNGFMNRELIDVGGFFVDLLSGGASSQLYFIVLLIQLTLLTPFIKKLDEYKFARICMYLVTPVFYMFLYMSGFNLPYHKILFPAWFIFYYIGIVARRGRIKILPLQKICILIVLTLVFSFMEALTLNRLFDEYAVAVAQVKLSTMLFALSVIMLVIYGIRNITVTGNNFLSRLGDISYGVYYVHMIVWATVHKVSSILNFRICLPAEQFIQLTLTTLISCIIVMVSKKIMGKYASIFLGF